MVLIILVCIYSFFLSTFYSTYSERRNKNILVIQQDYSFGFSHIIALYLVYLLIGKTLFSGKNDLYVLMFDNYIYIFFN